jgi:hypothetical protein
MSFALAGGSSRGRRQRRGEDVVHPLKVSLEDLFFFDKSTYIKKAQKGRNP